MKFSLLALLGLPLFCQTDWPSYAHDPSGQRFSPLNQINSSNVEKLELAWRFDFGGERQNTPIVAGGLMFNAYYSPGTKGRGNEPETGKVVWTAKVSAIEPETGKVVWTYGLGVGAPRRGLTYWPGDKQNSARIIVVTDDARMIALNAATGAPIPGFGVEGLVNLKAGVADKYPKIAYHVTSPAGLYKNLLITGSSGTEVYTKGPLQDIRAWDVRTGKLVWTFHLNPHPGEVGNSTWPEGAWMDAASPSAWGAMSVDEERGLVFLPSANPLLPGTAQNVRERTSSLPP